MKILALVLAGGEGSRLHSLTTEHAKPALPFADGKRWWDCEKRFVLPATYTSCSDFLRGLF